MAACLLAAILLALAAPAGADAGEELRIPKVGQPSQDFYGAAGSDVKLVATAVPQELTSDQFLTFTVTITNLINAVDVAKPSLKSLADFGAFQIEEGAELDPPTANGSDRRVFVYRLRPASEKVSLIPEIAFHYFDPKQAFAPSRPRDRFPRRFSNAVTIKVTPPDRPRVVEPTPLDVPGFAVNLAPSAETLANPSGNPPVWIWLVALSAPPLAAAGWVILWRRCYPGMAKLVLLKRNRAVRHALAAIARTKGLPPVEAANTLSVAVLAYLRERFELPLGAFTPGEIAAHLRCTGCPAERIALVQSFFRDCDDCRFAPVHGASGGITVDAEQLIVALEEPA